MAISKNPVQSSEEYIKELSNQIIIWMLNVHGTEPIESEIMNELKVMLCAISLIIVNNINNRIGVTCTRSRCVKISKRVGKKVLI